MSVAPTTGAKPVSPKRLIAASFAAGVGFMMLAGTVVTVVADGGFEVPSAHASTLAPAAPAVAPLDIAAIEAELARAEAAMARTQARTNRTVARLEHLASN